MVCHYTLDAGQLPHFFLHDIREKTQPWPPQPRLKPTVATVRRARGRRPRRGNRGTGQRSQTRHEGRHPHSRLGARRSRPTAQTTLRLIDELQPSNQAELNQVCQAARLTLAIERADRFEMAHMNQRIREAARQRVQEVNPRLLEEIQELGRRLLYIAAAEEVKVDRQPLWSDDPRLLVAKLEASAEGCRWLLARWAEFRILLDRGCRWNVGELLRFIRLQGKQVAESVYDPALNVIFVAWDVLVPKFAAVEWEKFREERFRTDPSFNHRQRWREIVARPGNAAEAREVLYRLVEDHVEKLNELLARNEAIEAVEDPDWADRAALDLSPAFERLRRYQSAKTRELQRTLDTLGKMRKAEFGMGNGGAEMADSECQITEGKGQMADEPCEVEAGGCELDTPQKAPNEANLVSTQDNNAQWVESEKVDPEGRERSQLTEGKEAVRGEGNNRIEAIGPADEGTEEARGRFGPSLPEAASQNLVPDEQYLPIVGSEFSRSRDATSATRPKTSLTIIAANAILRR